MPSIEFLTPERLGGSYATVGILYKEVLPAVAGIRRLFDVLYTSLVSDGAVAEVHFHLSRQPVFPSKIGYGLHRIRVRTAKSLRLPDLDAMVPLGVDPARYREILYEQTQAIGDAAYFLGFDSIIAPNARWSCNNLILFTDQIALADLEVIESKKVNWAEWRKKLK